MTDPAPLSYTFPSGQTLELLRGDLTRQPVDAIVNAANAHLAHGGGVAAAIVDAGGEIIQRESRAWVRQHGPVPHDQPAWTSAGRLPCRYVIHAVGPVWGEGDEEAKLGQAVAGSLNTAEQLDLHSLALPPISTGIFGFPKALAAGIFLQAVAAHFRAKPQSGLHLVRITIIDAPTYEIFADAFQAWRKEQAA
jgi:O-acetyl-ADP-ribose deacetylase